MAGSQITIAVDDAELRRWIGATLARIASPGEAFSEIGEVLQASTQQRFSDQSGPDGARWAENSPGSAARKSNPNILTEGGALGDTIDYQLQDGGRAVAVGSPMVYGAAHQFGMVKGYAGRTRRGAPIPWGDIPARPFLGVSEEDKARIQAILVDYLEQ